MRSSMPLARIAAALALTLLLSPGAASLRAQEGNKKSGAKKDAIPEQSPREKQILALFNASTKYFKDGRLYLEYDFQGERERGEEMVQDWKPTLAESRQRIRFARGYEGTWTTVEHGIVIGDFGQWLHKAVFLPDLEVKADFLKVSQVRPGNMLGPVFVSDKKKQSIGSNGIQAVCLKGHAPVKQPFPKTDRTLPPGQVRHTIGFKYDGKVLESSLNGKKTADTAASPKFTDGFESGRAGLAWGASVQSFVFKVVIEGKLDPDWVARELGETPGKASAGGTARAASRRR